VHCARLCSLRAAAWPAGKRRQEHYVEPCGLTNKAVSHGGWVVQTGRRGSGKASQPAARSSGASKALIGGPCSGEGDPPQRESEWQASSLALDFE